MFGRTFLRAALISTALAGVFAASPAAAQLANPAPVRSSVDGNGIDLFLGTFNVNAPALSIGASQGLSYYKLNRGGGWFDNLTASMDLSGSVMTVTMGGKTDTFTVGTTYTPTEGNGATLTYNSTTQVYTYTTSDGTVAHFNKNLATPFPYKGSDGRVTDITSPSGEKLTFSYQSLYYCSRTRPGGGGGTLCTAHSYAYRVASVRNGFGYRMTLSYGDEGYDPTDPDYPLPNFNIWWTPTGVTATNLAVSGSPTPGQSFGETTSGGDTLMTVSDAMSRQTIYRSTSGVLVGVKLPGSSSEDATVTYSSGKVSSITTPVGTTTYAYSDASGVRTVTVTNPAGKNTVYTFDIASRRMKSMTDATGRGTTWDHDSSGRVTRVTAQEGNYVQTTYDSRGNVTQTDAVSKSGTSTISTSATYDSTCSNPATCNQPITTTDARGNVTDYTYDSTTGNVLTVAAPPATTGATRPTTTYGYTSLQAYFDQGSGIVASGESVYRLTSTSICRTTASCAGTVDETRTTVDYGPQTIGTGNNLLPVSTTIKAGDNSLSATTAIGYDAIGNVTAVDGPLSGTDDTVTYRYDGDRERVGAIAPDPDGSGGPRQRAAVRTTYDPRGIATVTELGTVAGTSDSDWAAFVSAQQSTTTLDAAGRATRVVTTAGSTTYGVTEYSYDNVGRSDCVAVRLNPAYWGTLTDACTAETAGSSGADRIAQTTYDDAGRPLTTTTAFGTADAATERVSYTVNGKLETAIDAENNKTTYAYDGFDRLLTTTYPLATKGSGSSNTGVDYEQFTYDANGNVTNRRLRDTSNIGYTYDALNRVIAKDLPGSELDVAYTYYLTGQPLTASTTAQTVTLDVDALGRLRSQTTGTGMVAYQYDAAGRRTRMTWPDSFYVTYDYDTAGHLKAIKESGTTSLAAFDYDDLGRRTTLTRGNGVATTYGYDTASRLTSLISDPASTAYDLTLGFAYNDAGQIKSRTASNDAYSWNRATNVTDAFTANGLNQMKMGSTFGYDARGNLNASGSDSYSYSSENLLTSGTVGGVTTPLTYDPLLRLYQIGTTAGMKLVYDGKNIIGQSNGTTLGRRYVAAPDGDEVLVEYKVSNGTKDYKLTDERGSVIATTDASGNGATVNSYDEYGIPGSGNVGRFQYTGQFYLAELGLQYSKARMYAPGLGRFLQTDPIGYGDGSNWYNYVGGDPTNKSDPSGLETWGPIVIHCRTDCGPKGRGLLLPGLFQAVGGAPQSPPTPDDGSPVDAVVNGCRNGKLIGTTCILDINYNLPAMPRCPNGPRLTFGLGPSFTGFLGIVGISGGVSGNVTIPTGADGWPTLTGAQLSVTGYLTPMLGLGAFFAAGPSVNSSSSNSPAPLFSGSVTPVFQAGGSDGYGAEISRAINSDPYDYSGSGGRVGGGGYGAVGARFAGTISSPAWGCSR